MSISVSAHGSHISVVTIDNPSKANAMSRDMLAELADIWERLDNDHSCRAIVVTGAGSRSFTAGADVSGDLSANEETAAVINRALLKTVPLSKPMIAAVNGACLGGGIELLLAADIRYAAPHATFGLPEVKWAIYPFGGAAAKLVHQIDHVHAMKLLLSAENIDAEDAARIGLINEVVPAEHLIERAIITAEGIASNSPMAVQAVKRFVATGAAEQAEAREPFEQALGDAVRASPDFVEGVAAFRERRQPSYE
ncbi:MAG: enoyl-CoA hydratase/isomerase family protein [Acidimicrobiales bacterium]|jgi:enoyl-CoA hydratase/carnithine racemase|tara:strand:- start:209 stop:967 length:759 start_codon:yes stop_codon:yes gene_type:complete